MKCIVKEQADKISYLAHQDELLVQQSEAKRQRRKNRKRMPIRDAASYPELAAAMSILRNNNNYRSEYARARDVVSILDIYLTGMRMAELQHCTRATIEGLSRVGEVKFIVKKANNKSRFVEISKYGAELASNYSQEINLVIRDKEPTD